MSIDENDHTWEHLVHEELGLNEKPPDKSWKKFYKDKINQGVQELLGEAAKTGNVRMLSYSLKIMLNLQPDCNL